MESNWSSRKLVVTGFCLVIITVVPILYKHLGIANEITMLVLGAIATAGGVYNAFNTLAKKYDGQSDS